MQSGLSCGGWRGTVRHLTVTQSETHCSFSLYGAWIHSSANSYLHKKHFSWVYSTSIINATIFGNQLFYPFSERKRQLSMRCWFCSFTQVSCSVLTQRKKGPHLFSFFCFSYNLIQHVMSFCHHTFSPPNYVALLIIEICKFLMHVINSYTLSFSLFRAVIHSAVSNIYFCSIMPYLFRGRWSSVVPF